MSRFEPVFLEPGQELAGKASQTFLRHYNDCERSGYLYQRFKGLVQTVEMVRGSCCHAVYEGGTLAMVQQGEPSMPTDLIKVIVDEQLALHPLLIEEHDFVREQAYRWAEQTTIDPEAVVACETLFTLEVGGYQVRAKVDLAELHDGVRLIVKDYKTGKGAPNYDEISHKRPDKSISGRNFQLILYSLVLVFGREVRVEMERCVTCADWPDQADVPLCEDCHGAGFCRVEYVEPLPVAPRAQEVFASFVYPAIEDGAGLILTRDVTLTRLELEEYLGSLGTIVARLAHAEATGEWEAVMSERACGECPASALCPIPKELNDYRGEINTMEELVQACEVFFARGLKRTADRREIKAAAKALGGPAARVRFGLDRVWELGKVKESTEIPDKDGMFAAIQRAVDEGVPFNRADFVRPSKTTPFAERSLTEAELAEEAEQQQQEDTDEC